MENEFEWSAVIKFKGTEKEFAKMVEKLDKIPAELVVSVKESDNVESEKMIRPSDLFPENPGQTQGMFPFPKPSLPVFEQEMARAVKGETELSIKFPEDIRGGIITPHLHIGEKVVILSREKFKGVVSKVAAEMNAVDVNISGDFVEEKKNFKK